MFLKLNLAGCTGHCPNSAEEVSVGMIEEGSLHVHFAYQWICSLVVRAVAPAASSGHQSQNLLSLHSRALAVLLCMS